MQILIVDDQTSARRILQRLLDGISNIWIHEASNLEEARLILSTETIDLALVDIRLGENPRNRDGHILINEINQKGDTIAIVASSMSEMTEIREAMRNGAYDYLLKDALCKEMIVPIIENLRKCRFLETEVQNLRARSSRHHLSDFVLGTSIVMEELFSIIKRVALSDRSVLVSGPTGSGKELVVKSIHRLGANPNAPLMDINCGAIPENLIESQLFGHEKGAFTGAAIRQEGYLSAVKNGTLFLDEIAELPLQLQPGLLRVLETRTFRPLGSVKELTFSGRIVAATNADLEKMVYEKTFREDLLYRLNVFKLRVPSLNEHPEDIPALVAHFLSDQPRDFKFSDSAMQELMQAGWPGNIRQLRNTIDQISVLCSDDLITAEIIKPYLEGHTESVDKILDAMAGSLLRLKLEDDLDKLSAIDKALVIRAMKETSGNKTAATKLLGVHRKVIERRFTSSD